MKDEEVNDLVADGDGVVVVVVVIVNAFASCCQKEEHNVVTATRTNRIFFPDTTTK